MLVLVITVDKSSVTGVTLPAITDMLRVTVLGSVKVEYSQLSVSSINRISLILNEPAGRLL